MVSKLSSSAVCPFFLPSPVKLQVRKWIRNDNQGESGFKQVRIIKNVSWFGFKEKHIMVRFQRENVSWFGFKVATFTV